METREASSSTAIARASTGNFGIMTAEELRETADLGVFIQNRKQEMASADNEATRAIFAAEVFAVVEDYLQKPKVWTLITKLKGKRLGFRTDLDHKAAGSQYSEQVLRSVIADAITRDIRFIGNELNVIAGQAYATKESFQRKIQEHPSVDRLRIRISPNFEFEAKGTRGEKKTEFGFARTTGRAEWLFDGKPREYTADSEFPLVCNWYGTDTEGLLLGKMESRLLRLIWAEISGERVASVADHGLDDDPNIVDGEVVSSASVEPTQEEETPTPPAESLEEEADRLTSELFDRSEKWVHTSLEAIRKAPAEEWSDRADKLLETAISHIEENCEGVPSDGVEAAKQAVTEQVASWKRSYRGDRTNGS